MVSYSSAQISELSHLLVLPQTWLIDCRLSPYLTVMSILAKFIHVSLASDWGKHLKFDNGKILEKSQYWPIQKILDKDAVELNFIIPLLAYVPDPVGGSYVSLTVAMPFKTDRAFFHNSRETLSLWLPALAGLSWERLFHVQSCISRNNSAFNELFDWNSWRTSNKAAEVAVCAFVSNNKWSRCWNTRTQEEPYKTTTKCSTNGYTKLLQIAFILQDFEPPLQPENRLFLVTTSNNRPMECLERTDLSNSRIHWGKCIWWQ